MQDGPDRPYTICAPRPDQHAALGRLIVDAYASLPGMPGVDEQPGYYATLLDVATRARNPAIQVRAAIDDAGTLLGSVDFITDLAQYGAAGAAAGLPDAAGMRLLAVRSDRRGRGIGGALTRHCVAVARGLGKTALILHTTRAMQTAWAMYERMGFARLAAIDFQQGTLAVFGFRLGLDDADHEQTALDDVK